MHLSYAVDTTPLEIGKSTNSGSLQLSMFLKTRLSILRAQTIGESRNASGGHTSELGTIAKIVQMTTMGRHMQIKPGYILVPCTRTQVSSLLFSEVIRSTLRP